MFGDQIKELRQAAGLQSGTACRKIKRVKTKCQQLGKQQYHAIY